MLRYVYTRGIRNIIVLCVYIICQLPHSANSEHVLALNLAMIHHLGTPTLFFILSAADVKWPDVIQTRSKQWGVLYTDDEHNRISFEDKCN